MEQTLSAVLADNPIIAAVKDERELGKALDTDCQVIFLLFGTVCNIAALTDRIRQAGKMAFVHIDLVDGLSTREVAVTFLKTTTKASGIISTKPALIKAAKEQGLIAVQRFFLIDSLALANFRKYMDTGFADLIEVMPAAMPKVIKNIAGFCPVPIIAGGLISDKEDVLLALQNGALAVSTTNPAIWRM